MYMLQNEASLASGFDINVIFELIRCLSIMQKFPHSLVYRLEVEFHRYQELTKV